MAGGRGEPGSPCPVAWGHSHTHACCPGKQTRSRGPGGDLQCPGGTGGSPPPAAPNSPPEETFPAVIALGLWLLGEPPECTQDSDSAHRGAQCPAGDGGGLACSAM